MALTADRRRCKQQLQLPGGPVHLQLESLSDDVIKVQRVDSPCADFTLKHFYRVTCMNITNNGSH